MADHSVQLVQERTVVSDRSVRYRCSCGAYGTPFLPDEIVEARVEGKLHLREQARWAALDAVPCSHTIPGTCDRC